MNILTKVGAVGWLVLLGACTTLPSGPVMGSVSGVLGQDLRLCFPSGTKLSFGQEVDVLRREAVGSLRPPFTYVERKVGRARITTSTPEQECVSAQLMEGKAQRLDSVRALHTHLNLRE